jgi:hypothetical protein
MSVSKFSMALSRVRRMSAGAKRLKTSSDDSGSSQNYRTAETLDVSGVGQPIRIRRIGKGPRPTDVQYESSAGMCRSSDNLKMPLLKTSLESLAPIVALPGHAVAACVKQLDRVRWACEVVVSCRFEFQL